MKIIINADDCGISTHVNQEIERYISLGVISSTTVMANMEDFEGSCRLYEKYKNDISFGVHLNLTEGMPLRYSQLLLDKGYYKEDGGRIVFNEKSYNYSALSKEMKVEIYKELEAQILKLNEAGIKISHFDSHRHTHFHKEIILTFLQITKKYNINKMRCRQFSSENVKEMLKNLMWTVLLQYNNRKIKTADYFFPVEWYFNNIYNAKEGIYELMCHPGHHGEGYDEGNEILETSVKEMVDNKQIVLINYNAL